jgi:murein tripeptide amidase MpaA
MTIKISDRFDAGAIEVVDINPDGSIDLRLRKDSQADFSQWFYFRLQGARDQACTMRLLNAGQATYPDGWTDYLLCGGQL